MPPPPDHPRPSQQAVRKQDAAYAQGGHPYASQQAPSATNSVGKARGDASQSTSKRRSSSTVSASSGRSPHVSWLHWSLRSCPPCSTSVDEYEADLVVYCRPAILSRTRSNPRRRFISSLGRRHHSLRLKLSSSNSQLTHRQGPHTVTRRHLRSKWRPGSRIPPNLLRRTILLLLVRRIRIHLRNNLMSIGNRLHLSIHLRTHHRNNSRPTHLPLSNRTSNRHNLMDSPERRPLFPPLPSHVHLSLPHCRLSLNMIEHVVTILFNRYVSVYFSVDCV